MHKRREFISLAKIQKDFPQLSKKTLRKYMKKLGFQHRNKGGKRFMRENDTIVADRHNYLRKIKQYREEGWEIVYLDETWLNTNHASSGEWTHNHAHELDKILVDCRECGRHIPSGKGTRLIVLDAGSGTSGFIPGVGLIFRSKTNSADYHDEMNGTHFLEWFREVLVPALPAPSVIVMDNAPFHNIRTNDSIYPTSRSRKEDIIRWLDSRGIQADRCERKTELLVKVSQNKPPIRYITDEIAEQNGHAEQAEEKYFVAHRNTTFKLKDCEALFHQAKDSITQEKWKKAENYVIEKIERKFWESDGVQENEAETVIINIDDSDDDENGMEEDDGADNNNEGEDDGEDNGDDGGYNGEDNNDAEDGDDEEYINNDKEGGDGENNNDDENYDDRNVNDMNNNMFIMPTPGPYGDADVTMNDTCICAVCSKEEPDIVCQDIEWVYCDLCDRWLHVWCECRTNNVSESESYMCRACEKVIRTGLV